MLEYQTGMTYIDVGWVIDVDKTISEVSDAVGLDGVVSESLSSIDGEITWDFEFTDDGKLTTLSKFLYAMCKKVGLKTFWISDNGCNACIKVDNNFQKSLVSAFQNDVGLGLELFTSLCVVEIEDGIFEDNEGTVRVEFWYETPGVCAEYEEDGDEDALERLYYDTKCATYDEFFSGKGGSVWLELKQPAHVGNLSEGLFYFKQVMRSISEGRELSRGLYLEGDAYMSICLGDGYRKCTDIAELRSVAVKYGISLPHDMPAEIDYNTYKNSVVLPSAVDCIINTPEVVVRTVGASKLSFWLKKEKGLPAESYVAGKTTEGIDLVALSDTISEDFRDGLTIQGTDYVVMDEDGYRKASSLDLMNTGLSVETPLQDYLNSAEIADRIGDMMRDRGMMLRTKKLKDKWGRLKPNGIILCLWIKA